MTNFGIIDLHTNGIHIELGGVLVGKMQIPSDYVPRTFAPVLGDHYLITGDQLRNGLIVLLEDTTFRSNAPEDLTTLDEYELNRLNENSRWALVTDLQVIQRGEGGPLVKFTAIYADGTLRDRTYAASYKWAVLKEFKMLPVCARCGEVHEPKPEDDLEEMTRRVTSRFLGKEMSFDEFSDRLTEDGDNFVDEILSGIDSFFDLLLGGDEQPNSDNAVEIPVDRPQRPDETDDEYADRLRDEDEIAGEYNASERARIQQEKAEEKSLRDLRTALLGDVLNEQ